MNIKGQGHSLTIVQVHSDSKFSNFFSLETTKPIEAKFHMEALWDRENENEYKWFMSHEQDGHPYIVKTFNNLLLWNQKADDLETWYVALVTQVLPNLFK